ncbi:DUF6773 family protein [Clostridium merdae]|uniref:DUF6773 family protein n=1 Tax=Clostridium merdae TaxID=1958780 RepID=UPI001FA8B92A|nr:DUF6773 family protein [Clostridium merdae]
MKIQDERVLQINYKIQSEAYVLVLFLATASIIVKSYVLDFAFSQYVVEFGIIVLSTLYISIRSMMLGNNFVSTTKSGKRLTVLAIVVLSLIIGVITGVKNYTLYGDKYTGIFDGYFIATIFITTLSSVIFISLIIAVIYWFNNKGQKMLEKKLEEEDD